jgi:hypothetical protein
MMKRAPKQYDTREKTTMLNERCGRKVVRGMMKNRRMNRRRRVANRSGSERYVVFEPHPKIFSR